MKNSNLIITGARIVTPLGRTARKGKDMDELFDEYGSIEITEGKITYVGHDVRTSLRGTRSSMQTGKWCCPVLWTHTPTSSSADSDRTNSSGASTEIPT